MHVDDFTSLPDQQALDALIRQPAAAVWFSGPDCRVCDDLRPKVAALLATEFPNIARGQIECASQPSIAAHYQVFSVPLLLVLFDHRESLRLARNLSLGDLRQRLQRPYQLLFS